MLDVEGRGLELCVALARLGDREGSSSCFAADAWVGAVAEAGRRTGRVGDFGRGLVVGWDEGPLLPWAVLVVDDVCRTFGAAAVEGLEARGDCFFVEIGAFSASIDRLLLWAFDWVVCLGDEDFNGCLAGAPMGFSV